VGEELVRLPAAASGEPVVQMATGALVQQLDGLAGIAAEFPFYFDRAGERQFGWVTPYRDAYGLDWLIVTVIPESDFMTQIYAGNQQTLLSIAASMLGAWF
jgi:hypothetical protein